MLQKVLISNNAILQDFLFLFIKESWKNVSRFLQKKY